MSDQITDPKSIVKPTRGLPVRPNLDQLKHQAKDLLRRIKRGEPEAITEVRSFHPSPENLFSRETIKLADVQLVLARSYGAASWPRLVQSCELIDAIWRDDLEAVRHLIQTHPKLLHEDAGLRNRNWGPPMSYAANLGRDRIIRMLHALGARDTEWALGRAVLQGKIATARMLHEMLGSPEPPAGALTNAQQSTRTASEGTPLSSPPSFASATSG